jgi:hypothetical protein
MRRTCLVFLGLVLFFLAPAANAAIGIGVYGDVARFDRLTGQRMQSGLAFIGWDQGRTYGKPYSYFLQTLGDRPHIALQTDRGGGAISPRSIALGQGDAHVLGLAAAISEAGKPVLLRPLGEMNNSKNPYCYVTPGGGRKGATHLPRWYRKAFQRIYILMHGGTAALRFFDAYGNNYYHFGTWSFVRTTGLYKAFPSKPFMVPEWGLKPDDTT